MARSGVPLGGHSWWSFLVVILGGYSWRSSYFALGEQHILNGCPRAIAENANPECKALFRHPFFVCISFGRGRRPDCTTALAFLSVLSHHPRPLGPARAPS